jgi:hypothetical protein
MLCIFELDLPIHNENTRQERVSSYFINVINHL